MKQEELIRLIKLKIKSCREAQIRIVNELLALTNKGILDITKEAELNMNKYIILGNMQAYFDILNILSYEIVEEKNENDVISSEDKISKC